MTEINQWERLLHKGMYLVNQHLYYAAIETWERLLDIADAVPILGQSRVYRQLGRAYYALGDVKRAVRSFELGEQLGDGAEEGRVCEMAAALMYNVLGESDRAQRVLTRMIQEIDESPLLPVLHGNVAWIQWRNGFYEEGLMNTQKCLELIQKAVAEPTYLPIIYNNLGTLYAELGDYQNAEQVLQRALKLDPDSLSAMAELARAYLMQGRYEESLAYARRAAPLVWSSFMTGEKSEVAHLCQLYATLAYHMGETHIALRLIEKSQLLYGQLGYWREWQQVQNVWDDWERSRSTKASTQISPSAEDMEHLTSFLFLFDVLHAQELMDDAFLKVLDTRVLHAVAFAEDINLSDAEKDLLIMGCRFADYGLTAMEPEVAANPNRSPQAIAQYRQHPALSVEMLRVLHLPEAVNDMILSHHEHYDGSGYPRGLKDAAIPRLAQVLAICDVYSKAVVQQGLTHTEAITGIMASSGSQFDPQVTEAFLSLFRPEDSSADVL